MRRVQQAFRKLQLDFAVAEAEPVTCWKLSAQAAIGWNCQQFWTTSASASCAIVMWHPGEPRGTAWKPGVGMWQSARFGRYAPR